MFQGRLTEIPLGDLFNLIAGGRKSGLLCVMLDEREARIHIEEGKVVYARVEDGAHLGEYLVRYELLSAEEVQNLVASQVQENPNTPLGLLAVRQGIISQEDLERALQAQVMDTVSEVIAWSEITRSRFAFKEKDGENPLPEGTRFDLTSLLMEGTRRRDEWKRGQVKAHSVLDLVLNPNHEAQSKLAVGQWELLHLVDGQRTAASIAAEIALPEGETYHQLHLLVGMGFLKVTEAKSKAPSALVLSESHTTRRLITLTLTREKYRAYPAIDLEKVIDILNTHRPHCLVLDCQDIPAVVKEVRAQRNGQYLPIVALTREPRRLPWGPRLQGVRYVAKPYNDSDLISAVSAVTTRVVM